ncbi:hypothetical protein F5B22DRAFT_657451 [Xylaria bambusicola]|uniref:uncharacterized protein n=1 Tax=Xylaria bambusicola TaxID=326684 RepID=UPI0020084B73|nr:uncharacterized protein F5B22DRAFT_657451 [Xylaria bambusicola]KAI0513026.1 hypothetical protein F5B22DRAFT_657451 [Xylaria bambusicola]
MSWDDFTIDYGRNTSSCCQEEDQGKPYDSPSFPQFPMLPPELRFAVWELLALPRGPMRRETLFHLEEYAMPVMQYIKVNREARREILRGREVCIVELTFGSKPIFVNWELDLFEFYPFAPLYAGYGEDFMNKIRNIAFMVGSPKYRYGVPNAERRSVFGIDGLWRMDQHQPSQLFASVKKVVYLVGKSSCPYVLRESSEGVFKFCSWAEGEYTIHPDSPALRLNEYGLHTIEPTAYNYNDWCDSVMLRSEEGPLMEIPFVEWFDIASQEATMSRLPEMIGHEVEFQMMMYYKEPEYWYQGRPDHGLPRRGEVWETGTGRVW